MSQKVTKESYNSLSELGKIGIKPPAEEIISVDSGISLPLYIKGSPTTKTKTYFKPKIPKSGKSFYKDIYIRSAVGFNYMYCRNTSIFIAALVQEKDPKEWIDKNEKLIRQRLKEIQ